MAGWLRVTASLKLVFTTKRHNQQHSYKVIGQNDSNRKKSLTYGPVQILPNGVPSIRCAHCSDLCVLVQHTFHTPFNDLGDSDSFINGISLSGERDTISLLLLPRKWLVKGNAMRKPPKYQHELVMPPSLAKRNSWFCLGLLSAFRRLLVVAKHVLGQSRRYWVADGSFPLQRNKISNDVGMFKDAFKQTRLTDCDVYSF